MNIAIVEDNEANRLTLQRYLMDYAKDNQLTLHIDCYPDGIDILDRFKSNYDVIYLDVEMAQIDGMTTAQKIREVDEEVLIVFVTNFVQWAIQGYSVNATDFLLKPLTYFNFCEHFKKILKNLDNRVEQSIIVKSNSSIKKINLNDLEFIESEGHYLHFHMKETDFTMLESMKNMEKKLAQYDFFRCNNYYLVNLKYVKSVEKNFVMIGKSQLQISRPRKKQFMEALTRYIGEEIK